MRKLSLTMVLVIGGVAAADPSKLPSDARLAFGTPTGTGFDQPEIEAALRKSSTKLLACYHKARGASPDVHGAVTARFTIGVDGKVIDSRARGFDPKMDACIAATIAKLRFAGPEDGLLCAVSYPLQFELGGATNSAGPQPDGSITGTNPRPGCVHLDGSADRERIATTRFGTPVVVGGRTAAKLRRSIQVDDSGRKAQRLIYCYEKQLLADPTIQGLVVATFTIGRDGKVSSSSVSGLGEPAVETCMADTIKGFEFPTARARDTVVSYPISLCPPSRPRRLPPSGMRD